MDTCMLGEKNGHVCCHNICMHGLICLCCLCCVTAIVMLRRQIWYVCVCACVIFSYSFPISNSHLLAAR